jgi:hypothetical protein
LLCTWDRYRLIALEGGAGALTPSPSWSQSVYQPPLRGSYRNIKIVRAETAFRTNHYFHACELNGFRDDAKYKCGSKPGGDLTSDRRGLRPAL